MMSGAPAERYPFGDITNKPQSLPQQHSQLYSHDPFVARESTQNAGIVSAGSIPYLYPPRHPTTNRSDFDNSCVQTSHQPNNPYDFSVFNVRPFSTSLNSSSVVSSSHGQQKNFDRRRLVVVKRPIPGRSNTSQVTTGRPTGSGIIGNQKRSLSDRSGTNAPTSVAAGHDETSHHDESEPFNPDASPPKKSGRADGPCNYRVVEDKREKFSAEFKSCMLECRQNKSLDPLEDLMARVEKAKDCEIAPKGWLRQQLNISDDHTKDMVIGAFAWSIPVMLEKKLKLSGKQKVILHAWDTTRQTFNAWKRRFNDAAEAFIGFENPFDFVDCCNPFLYCASTSAEPQQLQNRIEKLKEELANLEDSRVPISDFELVRKSEQTKTSIALEKKDTKIRRLEKDNEQKDQIIKQLQSQVKQLSQGNQNLNRQLQSSQKDMAALEKDVAKLKKECQDCHEGSHKWRALKKKLHRRRYECDDGDADSFWALALAVSPQTSRYAAEPSFALATAAVLESLGILDELEDKTKVGRLTPCADTLGKLFKRQALRNYLYIINDIKENADAVTLTVDQSERGKTINNTPHYGKIISFWHKKLKRVVSYAFCMDGSGHSSAACADAIIDSLNTKLLGATPNGKIWSIGGDNGGGDSGECLFRELENRGIVDRKCPEDFEALKYARVSNCMLHNGSLVNEAAILKTMGAGGIDQRNATQTLHIFYDLQNSMERLTFQLLVAIAIAHEEKEIPYEEIDLDGLLASLRKKPKAYGQATTTRWDSIAGMAKRFLEDGHIIDSVARMVVIASGTDKARNKIASGLVSLKREPIINLDIKRIALMKPVYSQLAYNEFKKIGEVSKKSGFRGEQSLVIAFILKSNLGHLSNNKWKTDEKFGFRQHYNEIVSKVTYEKMNAAYRETHPDPEHEFVTRDSVQLLLEQQFDKVNLLIGEADKMVDKHIVAKWVNDFKIVCALLCGGLVTQMMAELLSCEDLEPSAIDPDDIHKYHYEEDEFEDIRIGDMRDFVLRHCTDLNEIRQFQFIKKHKHALQLLASGSKTLEDSECAELLSLLHRKFAIIASTNQPVELCFKVASHIASVHNRDEREKSWYLAFGCIIDEAKDLAWEESKKDMLKRGHTPKNKRSDVRGGHLTEAIMRVYFRQSEEVEASGDFDTNKQQLEKIWADRRNDAKCKRALRDAGADLAKTVAYHKGETRPGIAFNARMNQIGVDVTRQIAGKIKLSSISAKHIHLLQEELFVRGLIPGSQFKRRHKIKDLKGILQELVIGSGVTEFKPMHEPLFEACTDRAQIQDEDRDESDGVAETRTDDVAPDGEPLEPSRRERYIDVFERHSVSMKVAINVNEVKLREAENRERVKEALRAELVERNIAYTNDSVPEWRRLLSKTLKNREVCFIPRSKVMWDAVEDKIVPIQYVDDDFEERELDDPPEDMPDFDSMPSDN